MTGQPRRRVEFDTHPGVYRIGSHEQSQATLYLDARAGVEPAVTCMCHPADECLLYGEWNVLLACAPVPFDRTVAPTARVLERGRAHMLVIKAWDAVHDGRTWLILPRVDDLARVKATEVPRRLRRPLDQGSVKS